ncbi:MAG: histidine kinase dimerization/phosphoacceptor domain -containing protein [Leptolyngbyaceae bacterium]|nr:histidine kinase dimerization/phosphoacceptor domain -containing protein [Leptolyngbyaceae bacterium]
MAEFFTHLSAIPAFIPHGHCYLWKPGLVSLHVMSDALIALAYYSIPITLVHFVRKRQNFPFNGIFLLFGAFIIACGTTHVLEVWTLWHPTYWLSGLIKAITALISVYTAVKLVPLVPQALALPSPAQLEATNQELQKQIRERIIVEESLRHSEERYRAIVEDQTELIARFQPDGTLTFINEAYCRYFKRSRQELMNSSYEPVIFDADRELITSMLNSLNSENPVATIEHRVIVDGEVRWMQWINRIILDDQDRFIEFQSVGRDINARKQAEQQLQTSLKVLLKEVHHRVKNNLQMVYSLLRLQYRRIKDQQAAEVLLESQNRVKSISLIHEKLYGAEDVSKIDFAQYISSLTASLFSSYNISSATVTLNTQVEAISLAIDKAIPCGLIINELVSNSLKYAFPERSGQIQVELTADQENQITLIIKDDGIGLPEQFDLTTADSLGLQLVQDFVAQLEGAIQIVHEKGTEFRIVFPAGAA